MTKLYKNTGLTKKELREIWHGGGEGYDFVEEDIHCADYSYRVFRIRALKNRYLYIEMWCDDLDKLTDAKYVVPKQVIKTIWVDETK